MNIIDAILQALEDFSGLLTVIATAVIGLFTYRLWSSTNKLWESGEKQLKIAQEQINNSKKSTDAMIQSNRPYVIVKEAVIRGFAYESHDAAMLSRGAPADIEQAEFIAQVPNLNVPNINPKLLLQLENYGNSPVWLHKYCLHFLLLPSFPKEPEFQDLYTRSLNEVPIPPGKDFAIREIEIQSATTPGEITYDEFLSVMNGKLNMYAWGYIKYNDVFRTHTRKSGFGFWFNTEKYSWWRIESDNYWKST